MASRIARFLLLGFAFCAIVSVAHAADPNAADEGGFWESLFRHIISFDSNGLMTLLGRPRFATLAFIAINLIVFVETGLLIGFFLPGDSLLVTAGLIAANPLCGWNLPLLMATVSISAIVGDTIGYSIGYKSGPLVFNREKSWFFKKDHLVHAQAFYDKHGGKTIILARFIPILRTFAPVVAGVGRMEYRRFLAYNVFGGIGWVCSMILVGYFLPSLLNPLLRPYFGPEFAVEKHVEKVVIVVVFLSVSPGLFFWLKKKLAKPSPTA